MRGHFIHLYLKARLRKPHRIFFALICWKERKWTGERPGLAHYKRIVKMILANAAGKRKFGNAISTRLWFENALAKHLQLAQTEPYLGTWKIFLSVRLTMFWRTVTIRRPRSRSRPAKPKMPTADSSNGNSRTSDVTSSATFFRHILVV